MLAIFVILGGIIGVFGPGHVEGGFDAIKEKGVKAAIETAVDEADSSTLVGNYGNK